KEGSRPAARRAEAASARGHAAGAAPRQGESDSARGAGAYAFSLPLERTDPGGARPAATVAGRPGGARAGQARVLQAPSEGIAPASATRRPPAQARPEEPPRLERWASGASHRPG